MNNLWSIASRTVGCVMLSIFAMQSSAAELPAHERLLGDDVLKSFKIDGAAMNMLNGEAIESQRKPALRVTVNQRTPNDYDAQYEMNLPTTSLKKGDVIWAAVSARMISTRDESGRGVLSLVLEQNKDPWDKVIERKIYVGRDWEEFSVPVKVSTDFPANSLHVTLRLGGAIQTLEIANLRLVRFSDANVDVTKLPQTLITYGGREADAPWRKTAEESIEKNRKAPLTIHVRDAAGNAVNGASVEVAMQRHAYVFGSCYNPNPIAGDVAKTAESEAYRKHFLELFNAGVDEYAMKWPEWESPETKKMAIDSLAWMQAHGVRVRGHNLVWPSWGRMPSDVKTLAGDKAALAKRVRDHVQSEAKELAGRVTEWDVVNEPYTNHDVMDVLGDEAMADWFKAARAGDANVPLYLNETSVPTSPPGAPFYDVLFSQAKALQSAGAPLGGIGMQGHFGSSLTSIDDLQKIYDRFATLNVPLKITELDVDVQDETLQADYMRDLLTITFAHPNSTGVMLWGFVANYHWKPDAAMYRADWTPKPAATMWRELVLKKWWTHETLTTASNGSANTRGFLGTYKVTVKVGSVTETKDVELAKDGATIDVVLK